MRSEREWRPWSTTARRLEPEIPVRTIDAFGRIGLEMDHPDWQSTPNLPHTGNPQMYLEMTLVDNHNGLVLWHAHQVFPANAASPGDLTRAARTMLASLPAH